MGKYDSQLKNYYEKQTSGKADLGLYQKQNKDGSVSASKEVQDRAAANRHIYAEIAPTLANSTNKAGYASWMKPNNDVYFGSQTFDGDAFNAARSDFMDNFMLNTKTANKNANHPKYGYDWNDPEDVQRYEQGKISKKYEGTYTDDPFDQFLKAYGQASSGYFTKTYYPKAYSKVIADRAEQQKAKNFKNAVIQEVWSTASDCMNITDEEMVSAYQRVLLNNPEYKDIEIYNPKDKDTDYSDYSSPILAEQAAKEKDEKNRVGKLSIDEIWGDLEKIQKRQQILWDRQDEQTKAEAEAKSNQSQSIINAAISKSGFSVNIDKRVGLARDSKLNEYNDNKQKKQAASDSAIAAMREAGYSNQDIQKAIRQDGRLSYSESTEGKANEAERIARRDSSDATSAKILNGMDSFTQGAVDKAKKLGNMGTSSQKGFSPISMMEGYGLSEQETRAVNSYIDTATAVLEAQGYEPLEIDNTLRRADLGEYIPKERARVNYSTYTLKECGLTDEQIQQVLATYTEEDWKNTDKDMLASDYVENSMADQLANSIISMPIRAALSIACGAVGVVDMGAAAISGRAKLWKFTDELQDMSAWWTQFSHDRNHKVISTAADVGAEIMRMRATSLIGSALTPAATTTSGSAAGTNFLFNFMQKNASRLPFISGAIGNYYLEAVNGGAAPRMAALYAIPAGALEGYLESLEMGEVLQHSFGMNIVGKKIAASGLSANFKQFAITKGMPFINFALGTIGEGLEEAASYSGSSIARIATWDKGYEMDFSEMWDNAKGGLLIGGIMNGLSMGAHTQSYKYASEIYKGTGGNYAAYLDSFMSAMHMENMNDVQRQALIDKYNSGEINVSRDAAINAGVEIQTNAEVVSAKKQAVESAENDAAVKVENANNKVTQAEQRLASIDDPDPVKKGKKIAQASRELSAAKAAASQTASEGQKKVDTATADYKSEAAKAKRKNAANQQLVDEYHASKYCSDIEAETDIAVEAAITAEDVASLESLLQSEKDMLAAMPYQNSKAAIRRKDRIAKLENQIASGKAALNAAVSPAAVEPTANTNADANTAQNGIDTIKNGVAEQDAQKVQSAEPALKDLGANTPSPVEMKQSKVHTNTYDKWLTEAEKSADSVENSMYAVSREADTLSNAREIVRGAIENDGNLDGAMRRLNHGIWDATDVDTAMLIGETLRSEAAETGDYTKLNDWKKEIQRHMTESGQAIQALAKWTRDSSVGAEAALDKAVADINRKNQKAIDKGKIAPVEVDPELLNELRSAQTRAERDAVMNKIAADIGSKMPAGILDKIRAWRYLSMLGNPRTVLRNLIGNEIMSDVLWTSKDAVGAALEKVMGVEQSQRTKALAFGDAYKANKAYAATTLDDARTALEDSSRYDTKSGIERAIDENRQIFKFKPVEKWREATDWALSKGDTVFLEKQYKRSFAQIMTARGYTPDTITAKQRSECMSYAINEAKRSTFHDANSLADAMTKIENKNLATKILVGGTVPFKKTPLNVLARGVEFSPIGLIQGTGQMLTDVKAGKMDASTAIDKMSSGLVGSSLMALGYFLAKSGVISGGDNDEDKYYQSDLGKQEYALNLPGSSSMTIDWAAPASIPLFMGVALQELIDGSGSSDEAQTVGDHIDAFLGTLSSITDPLVEMSMLQGLQDTLEAVANARSDGNSLIGAALVTAGRGYASQFVPTIGGQIARTIDPVRRDTAGDPTSELGKDLDKATNKMQAKIPGLASDLQPYINVWGEQEINEHSWPVRLLEQAILPGYLDGVDMTPVDVELTRLYSVTQAPSVVPSNYLSYRTLKNGDERYVLTADEYTEFKIENGRAMYAAAEDAINSSQYSRMSDDEKASYVAKAIRDAQDDILKRYKKKYLGK